VARLPEGKDPGDLAGSDPAALVAAVAEATPFLGFRLERLMARRPVRSPEDRARLAEAAMAVVNEHPDVNLRRIYAGQVATHVGLPAQDLVAVAERGTRRPSVQVSVARRVGGAENAEFVALALLLQRWDDIAPWLIEALFADDTTRRAFVALVEAGGHLERALELADPQARELLERAAVADVEGEPEMEARNLIAAAVRREVAQPLSFDDPEGIAAAREARVVLEGLDDPAGAPAAAEWLLGWLDRRNEERG
jgi:DNA primase